MIVLVVCVFALVLLFLRSNISLGIVSIFIVLFLLLRGKLLNLKEIFYFKDIVVYNCVKFKICFYLVI